MLLIENISFVDLANLGEPTPLSTNTALSSSSDGACPAVTSCGNIYIYIYINEII
jgi:hypothetical protein